MRFDIEHLPTTLYLADQVRELDRIAIHEYGIAGFELMSKAARFAFHAMIRYWPKTENILVLCGAGNNAGDGYVLASIAKKKGLNIRCITFSDPEKLSGDAKTAFLECLRTETEITSYQQLGPAGFVEILHSLPKDSVLVDALFGTGLCRAIEGDYLNAIQQVNERKACACVAKCPLFNILAIDIPSGLNANTGQILGDCLKADLTATFIGNKLGLMTGKGQHYCGTIVFDDLGVPDSVYSQLDAEAACPHLEELIHFLGPRASDSHKGKQGRALLVGGNHGFSGAILIGSQSCARLGAGLTSVITQPEHCSSVVLHQPEVMAHHSAVESASDLFKLSDVIGIGPGLGQDLWAYQLLEQTLKQRCYKVLDADALNLLAKHRELQELLDDSVVLTPHPGEAARLLETSTGAIEQDRLRSLKQLHEKFSCHIVLKGSGTLIMHPKDAAKQTISVSRYGNPGMASGGMGDSLTGMLCAIIAQGLSAEKQMSFANAIELAVCLHSAAADKEAEKKGERGLLASDLAETARRLLNHL
jgi:NAD(P)H-hydrate epimerase